MSKTQISTSGDDQTFESVRSDISTTTRDSQQQQHKSESSCSNSLFINPPVSFPTRKFPEISKGTVGKSSACSDISDNISDTKGKFDLNEDIYLNGTGGLIRVIPKIGVPNGKPVFPLEFKGGLGWTGSAKTSAFRAGANFSTGFDLNVALVDDTGPHSDLRDGFDSKRAENLCIDLNRIYDAGNEFTQPCALAVPSRLLDLNLGNQDFNPFQPKFPFLPRIGTRPYFPVLFSEQHTSNVKSEGNLSNEARKFLFLDNNSSRDERLRKDEWFGPSVKRKEPDRGSDQIGSLRAWL